MAIMVADPLLDEKTSQRTLGTIGLIGALAALAATLPQAHSPGFAFWSMVKVDAFSVFFHILITSITAVVILVSYEYMVSQQISSCECYRLILLVSDGFV